jgi:APA family basic amino acid/polyamine antiporter
MTDDEVKLERDLGLLGVTMIGVGAMIGAGIFVLTGIAAGTAGPALILAFLLNGAITLITAMVYAELGSAIPEAGGGYLWVKEALPSVNGFLSGWMSWFAHSVAGSLYALGFGAYFGWLLSEFGITIFGMGELFLQKFLAVVIIIIFIFINYKGVSETGKAATVVAVVKIAILGVFIISGLYTIFLRPDALSNFYNFMPEGLGGVFMAMGLTFIAFEGYEIIAQAGEEVKNPKRNIPKAIFFSLAIVIPIYILVAFTAIGAITPPVGTTTWQYLGAQQELGLVEAARQFMPFGTVLLLIGGLIATMSALNATTFSSTRVSFAMGRDFNLPSFFRKVHQKNRTPHQALFVTGFLVIFMAVALPLVDVAIAANVMFVLLFLQVNVAVITIRKKRGKELDYGYKIPLFPYLPIIGIGANALLAVFMVYLSPMGWLAALVWIGIGVVIYFTYATAKENVEKEKIEREENPEEYRIVVLIKNPEDIRPLINIGTAVAKAQESEVVALQVIKVPYQTFLRTGRQFVEEKMQILDKALKEGEKHGVKIHKKVIISHDVAQAILDFVQSAKSTLIVMGWTGNILKSKVGTSMHHKVLLKATCDVSVIKQKNFKKIKKILVPIGMGDHTQRLRIAGRIAKSTGASITVFSVIHPDDDEKVRQRIDEIQDKCDEICSVKTEKEIAISNKMEDILIEKSSKFDLLVIGPSRDWVLRGALLGSVTDKIANNANCTVLMLKHPELIAESWSHLILKKMFKIKKF